MISVTVTDRSGRTLSGQTIDAFWVSIAHAKPFSVGINCALGARDMRPVHRGAGAHRGLLHQLLSERRTAERVRRVRRTARSTPAASCASSPTAASSTSSAAAAGRRRITSRRSPTRWSGLPPRSPARRGGRTTAQRPGTLHAVRRARDADDPSRQQLPDDRRADQRHRLRAVRAADPSRTTTPRPPRSRSTRCAAAPT